MLFMNDYLSTLPFDLYELSLFHLVARHRSFTKAAEAAGLTQSAITRQIQGMENSLGISLLERTTRTVSLTPAGKFLHQESAKLLGDVDSSLRRLKEDFTNARKEIRLGVSRSIGMAYLPGFFHASLRRGLKAGFHVAYQPSAEILPALEANELDLGVLCPPPRLPPTLTVTHRFTDAFTLFASTEAAAQFQTLPKSKTARLAVPHRPESRSRHATRQLRLNHHARLPRHGREFRPHARPRPPRTKEKPRPHSPARPLRTRTRRLDAQASQTTTPPG
jgi:DNA-binding transcriptional LysR family regulator